MIGSCGYYLCGREGIAFTPSKKCEKITSDSIMGLNRINSFRINHLFEISLLIIGSKKYMTASRSIWKNGFIR